MLHPLRWSLNHFSDLNKRQLNSRKLRPEYGREQQCCYIGSPQLRQHSNLLWPDDRGFYKKGPNYVFTRDPVPCLRY